MILTISTGTEITLVANSKSKILLALFVGCIVPIFLFAHSGGLDKNGCHTNRKTGDYHCHGSPAAAPTAQPAPKSNRSQPAATAVPQPLANFDSVNLDPPKLERFSGKVVLAKACTIRNRCRLNTISTAKPKPVLRIALVGYRDLQDTYVTRVYDFTTNLEVIYGHLREFHADGGGDTPEHVNQALHESVNKLSWSKNPAALKIIYLVGDAPPHLDYQDGFDYKKVARRAASTGIIINTIQCGNLPVTQEIWKEIARTAEGKYAAIDQTGGMVNINSPYDAELARLSGEFNKTYVAYGKTGRINLAAQKDNDKVAAAAPSAAADRASSKASFLYKNESWDLVDAIEEDEHKLDQIPKEELPEELRSLSQDQQKAYLKKKETERANLQLQIKSLAKKRQSFLDSEMKKTSAKKDAFDEQVLTTLKEQGKSKNIAFAD